MHPYLSGLLRKINALENFTRRLDIVDAAGEIKENLYLVYRVAGAVLKLWIIKGAFSESCLPNVDEAARCLDISPPALFTLLDDLQMNEGPFQNPEILKDLEALIRQSSFISDLLARLDKKIFEYEIEV